jgi:hypothetical protein
MELYADKTVRESAAVPRAGVRVLGPPALLTQLGILLTVPAARPAASHQATDSSHIRMQVLTGVL